MGGPEHDRYMWGQRHPKWQLCVSLPLSIVRVFSLCSNLIGQGSLQHGIPATLESLVAAFLFFFGDFFFGGGSHFHHVLGLCLRVDVSAACACRRHSSNSHAYERPDLTPPVNLLPPPARPPVLEEYFVVDEQEFFLVHRFIFVRQQQQQRSIGPQQRKYIDYCWVCMLCYLFRAILILFVLFVLWPTVGFNCYPKTLAFVVPLFYVIRCKGVGTR